MYCEHNMQSARKERGKTQTIFLIETVIGDKDYERTFIVRGTTKNIYSVTITNKPKCTCPDHVKNRNRCKHIYFVLLRIMRINNEDEIEYTNEELIMMFDNMPDILRTVIIDPELKKKYDLLKENNKLLLDPNKKNKVAKKDTEDMCPVCMDDLENGEELDHCKHSCGKNIHKMCFNMWVNNRPRNCIFCGNPWDHVKAALVYTSL